MEEISNNIFIETGFPGVVLGVISLNRGLVMIDMPFRSNDQQTWLKEVEKLGGSKETMMVMLDTHLDRSLGLQTIEFNVLAHNKATEILRDRPLNIRLREIDSGGDWEFFEVPANLRWPVPDMTYSEQMVIHWDDSPVIVTHQPGVHPAASWVRDVAGKLIFIGDGVVLNQPPFIAWSDLELWMGELSGLLTDEYRGYKIISGRQGLIRRSSIEKMLDYLGVIKSTIEEVSASPDRDLVLTEAVSFLLKKRHFNQEKKENYRNRFEWGLNHYLQRKYPEPKIKE